MVGCTRSLLNKGDSDLNVTKQKENENGEREKRLMQGLDGLTAAIVPFRQFYLSAYLFQDLSSPHTLTEPSTSGS